MASVSTLLFVAVLPPLAVLLITVAGRAAVRGVGALARAHFAWPAGSPFMHVDQALRKGGRWAALGQRDHELRVTLHRRRKNQGGGVDEPAVECVFCLSGVEEGEEVRELRCRHVFHRACLDRWLATPPATCPLCRSRLLTTPPRAGEEEEELDLDSDLVLLMAYVHGGGSNWFWSP
ncbi:E3 ubiquitin-protein ligase Arkadia-like [Lolium rigidum]|uniref:E3 ubiquitin-protein ligase Arkadia-like n=1 Tax=Lolium rigidum TaxID=89674 RepID=UPI001F5C648B|nr:E3 ubiquitin-protein ligase Arkadia-like [Lolium rigidum]